MLSLNFKESEIESKWIIQRDMREQTECPLHGTAGYSQHMNLKSEICISAIVPENYLMKKIFTHKHFMEKTKQNNPGHISDGWSIKIQQAKFISRHCSGYQVELFLKSVWSNQTR